MPISQERLAEIAAIGDQDIDTSDIPEADEAWFKDAKLVIPQKGRSTANPIEAKARRGSTGTAAVSMPQPRSLR